MEAGVRYWLRLARACLRRVLVAAAEHKSLLYLLASFDSVGKKRKGGDGDGDGAGESKRHRPEV